MTIDERNDEQGRISRRELLQKGALGGLGAFIAAGAISIADVEEAFASWLAKSGPSKKLIAAAKKEGHLNAIALPSDWANYGQIMTTFQHKYGISITDANPLGTSAQELAAITGLKGQSRAPDAVDVSGAIADQGRKEGLFAPYKVSTWSTIPKKLKNAKGYYYGDYWGAMSFLSVSSVVKHHPKDWSDLLKPEYKGQVAIDGPPTQAGDAFGAVMAAALANGGSLNNIAPGIDWFAKLKSVGNWNPTDAYTANIEKGATPIAIKWDYLNLATRDEMAKNGQKAVVSIPKTGVYGGPYFQAINKYAPHPHAARLWMEFLYSDQGQLLWLKGYTHPARYNALAKQGKIPKALAKKLPPASSYKHVKFATVAQINKANTVLMAQWGSKVGGS